MHTEYAREIVVVLIDMRSKTGITLPDMGTRDEHGLEPMEHIFSSPVKDTIDEGYGTVGSSGMDVQESELPLYGH